MTTLNNAVKNIKITNEKNVSKDDIIKEAITIWTEVKKEIKIDKLVELHKDFYMAYPLVVRYMTDFNSFYTKVFIEYINLIEKNPWKTETEYFMMQAEYVAMLFIHEHKNETNVNELADNIRTNIFKVLEKESQDFKNKVKEETEKEETKLNILKLDNRKYLKSIYNDIPIADKIIIKYE